MPDDRIIKYIQMTQKMIEGEYSSDAQMTHSSDDLGRLGFALQKLSSSLDTRFKKLIELNKIFEKVNSAIFLGDVLDHVYQSFHALLPYDRLGFSLIETDPFGKPIVKAHWNKTEYPDERRKISMGYSALLEGSSLEKIIQSGVPRIINDLEDYYRKNPKSQSTALAISEGIRSSLTCPLVVLGKPIGFLFFSSSKAFTYENSHIKIYEKIAGQLVNVVEKSRLYQELFDLNNLKSRFLGMAAHDLRTPATNIISSVDLILSEDPKMPLSENLELLKLIQQSGHQMLELINAFLESSVIETGNFNLKKQSVELFDLLKDCLLNYEPIAKNKGLSIVCERTENIGKILVDPHRLRQAIENILGNAIKFSPSGKSITLKTEIKDGELLISCIDHGVGIPKNEIDLIFNFYHSASNSILSKDKSTGLGLAIAKKVVDVHGGWISVESELGVGTTFTIHFPLKVILV